MQKSPAPTILVILDGLGYSPNPIGNAINPQSMPHLFNLYTKYPSTLLHAAGKEIGMLPGYIGNSEIGHQAIGTGRVIPSVLRRLHDDIADHSLLEHPVLVEQFKLIKQADKKLHIIGLLSDSGVHSHELHMHEFVKAAAAAGLTQVFLHVILDGRDAPPQSAAIYLSRLESVIKETGVGVIASLHGRFYAMDRDNNWERTEKSYAALCRDTAPTSSSSWQSVINENYKKGDTDEFVMPIRLINEGIIGVGDGVIFSNFRADRAHQLSESLINPVFSHFPVHPLKLSCFITPIRFDERFKPWGNQVLYHRMPIVHTLVEEVITQTADRETPKVFAIAETEKYAHVTYFFNGGDNHPHPGEERLLIPSIKSKNYINHPQMSAPQITDAVLHSVRHHPALLYVINYANLDMVGHSGDMGATLKAAAIIDEQLDRLYEKAVLKFHATMYITGDHGNAEAKIDPSTGLARTAHTANPVPFVMIHGAGKNEVQEQPKWRKPTLTLANIAPTILHYMHLQIPPEMEQTKIFTS